MKQLRPAHAAHPYFSATCANFRVGGLDAHELVRLGGQTPLYVYSRDAIDHRVAELRHCLPPAIRVHYALKANPMPELVRFVGTLVDGMDVASGAEMRLALSCGVDPTHISFAGPGKTAAELHSAARAGVCVNAESERELTILAEFANQYATRPRVAIRVNPDFELKSSGMKMAGGPKQFGIDAEKVPAILERMRGLPLEFIGFHIFSGSQNLRAESIIESQQRAYELAVTLARSAPCSPRMLNLGGGFGIPYFPGEQPLQLASIGASLAAIVKRAALALPGTELVVELGRYLVGEAGVYLARVIDRKESRGRTFLVTDGGLHHHLAASGNFGQVIRKDYPVVIASNCDQGVTEVVSVVGPLCTPLDLLADQVELPRVSEGALVAVLQSGAYGRSASPLGFLSHPAVIELMV